MDELKLQTFQHMYDVSADYVNGFYAFNKFLNKLCPLLFLESIPENYKDVGNDMITCYIRQEMPITMPVDGNEFICADKPKLKPVYENYLQKHGLIVKYIPITDYDENGKYKSIPIKLVPDKDLYLYE